MSNVVAPDFPQRAALARPAPRLIRDRACRASEVDVAWIARQLGIADRPPRTIIARIRVLAERCSFPLPKTPRFFMGARVRGPASIDAFSIWDKDPVERWLEDDLPPTTAAASVVELSATTRSDLAARARALVA